MQNRVKPKTSKKRAPARRSGFPRARFVTAAHRPDQLPEDAGREVAIAGRSNGGKSSALNAITGVGSLARVSKTPGRTQQLVVFELEPGKSLIDLPGYGYAAVPESLRAHWGDALPRYFAQRQALAGLIVTMDVRHPLRPGDVDLLDLAYARGLPAHLLLTKADKLGRAAQGKVLAEVARLVGERWGERFAVQLFSSFDGTGVGSARGALRAMLAG